MKSDVIMIDNRSNGFETALEETRKVAAYQGLDRKETMRLLLCAEEMLSMARSVTGEMQASFWIETAGKDLELHMSTKTVMDKEKRALLISAATSRKNESARSLLGRIRDAFEAAMANEADHSDQVPWEAWADLANHPVDDPEWDGYEQSVLRKVADQVKVGIRGSVVDLTVCKHFE